MRHSRFFFSLVWSIGIGGFPLFIGAVSSTSFQIDPADNTSSSHRTNSTSYILEGSVTPLGSLTQSSSFKSESGASTSGACGDGFADPDESCDGTDLAGATCVSRGFVSGTLTCTATCTFNTSSCVSSGGSGSSTGAATGGGPVNYGIPMPPSAKPLPPRPETAPDLAPTIDARFLKADYVSYESQVLLSGEKDAPSMIEVNGKEEGVIYPNETTWNKKIILNIGTTKVTLVAKQGTVKSSQVVLLLKRHRRGDITGDRIVNDYDLSRLIRLFGTSQGAGDFNNDGQVDDFDLSQLVSGWDTGK